ncbi:MAG TPA: YtcA family lipoprotein [Candidatus Methylacidiphilales bacterium]|nr:YtcA family lipoprotein [Candidatus Methylacidiphilales bacterium]
MNNPSHHGRAGPAIWLGTLSSLLLAGCSRNPSLEISGSFFPAWMLSIFIGLIATLVAKRIFLATRIDPHLTPQLLVYGALMISFTLLTWLLLYW